MEEDWKILDEDTKDEDVDKEKLKKKMEERSKELTGEAVEKTMEETPMLLEQEMTAPSTSESAKIKKLRKSMETDTTVQDVEEETKAKIEELLKILYEDTSDQDIDKEALKKKVEELRKELTGEAVEKTMEETPNVLEPGMTAPSTSESAKIKELRKSMEADTTVQDWKKRIKAMIEELWKILEEDNKDQDVNKEALKKKVEEVRKELED